MSSGVRSGCRTCWPRCTTSLASIRPSPSPTTTAGRSMCSRIASEWPSCSESGRTCCCFSSRRGPPLPANVRLDRLAVHVLSPGDGPGTQFADQVHQTGDGGLEQDFPFLRCGLGGIAVDSRLRPAAPEIVEAYRVVPRAIAADKLAHAIIIRDGQFHAHSLRGQVQVERRLE